jgi:rhodanese-related sulfurtransferase
MGPGDRGQGGEGEAPAIEEWPLDVLERAVADPGRTVVLLDVRTPGEYLQGSLPGAVSMPLDEIDARHGELPADAEIVCLCPDGERSAVAAVILRSLGHPRSVLLSGGLGAAGIETDEGGSGPQA